MGLYIPSLSLSQYDVNISTSLVPAFAYNFLTTLSNSEIRTYPLANVFEKENALITSFTAFYGEIGKN